MLPWIAMALTLTATRRFADRLRAALGESLPYFTRDGGFIATGYDAGLDELRQLATDTKVVLAKLQAAYAAQTGIKTLKIQYNQVFGYFVEVSPGTAAALAGRAAFGGVPPQADAGQRGALHHGRAFRARKPHPERHERSAGAGTCAVRGAGGRGARRRGRDCERRRSTRRARLHRVRWPIWRKRRTMCARMWTTAAASSSKAAGIPPWSRRWRARAAAFIGNDCKLDGAGERAPGFLVVTGPNMAGKSTYLRQNALLAVLAQAGSYVPATSAHIGVADRLFARIGAADDLARGRSTFMVEMTETAAILNQATPPQLRDPRRDRARHGDLRRACPSPGRCWSICTT